ncbi:hypothetical protein [Cellvibrio sp. PSBB006]|uniref:hypothetical protein n=1 Tax=Cellvibrio sp. PSBB006 TaxID=1987723 RepID=UPI000B3B67CF|nr:hypothetical protein [Cellvibrio sp. PSBB006]ARU27051.1 hypothetical protein CBR65_06130 [Cellvibrio sp. PSBB006]
MHKLLAVVEVDKDARVYCQSPSCTRTVYKQIHIVNDNGKITVFGCKCYEILYGNIETFEEPFYSSGKSRLLTDEERTLLLENTQLLIEKFENEEQEAKNAQCFYEQPIPQEPTNHPMVAPLREVTCHYCGCSMRTRAKSTPAVGHKCDLCAKFNRGYPSRRSSLTKEMNARANLRDRGNDDPHHKHGQGVIKEKNNAATEYRKATGK